jgi:hypothetical protein
VGANLTARVAILVVALAGCDKAPPPAVACPAIDPTPHADPATWRGAREKAILCIKAEARRLVVARQPLAAAADGAVAHCAATEAKALTALRKLGPVYPYQYGVIRDEYAHLALVSATQAKAIGCGRAPGSADDRLPGARWS